MKTQAEEWAASASASASAVEIPSPPTTKRVKVIDPHGLVIRSRNHPQGTTLDLPIVDADEYIALGQVREKSGQVWVYCRYPSGRMLGNRVISRDSPQLMDKDEADALIADEKAQRSGTAHHKRGNLLRARGRGEREDIFGTVSQEDKPYVDRYGVDYLFKGRDGSFEEFLMAEMSRPPSPLPTAEEQARYEAGCRVDMGGFIPKWAIKTSKENRRYLKTLDTKRYRCLKKDLYVPRDADEGIVVVAGEEFSALPADMVDALARGYVEKVGDGREGEEPEPEPEPEFKVTLPPRPSQLLY